MTTDRLKRIAQRHTYLFALVLLVITLMVNYALQSNLFELRVLNSNLRNFLPLIVLTLGQTIVIIGGGIDLSVGAMVSMSNAILVTLILPDSGPGAIVVGVVVTVLVGMAAGAFNGFCVAYLRLQPA